VESGLEAMRITIREKEPVRPSTRLRQLTARAAASSEVAASTSQLSARHSPLASDLDWIVMKCLEKDRTRRYETANGLAMDIQRYLANEPVVARPPSTVYKARTFVRRNRTVVAVTASIFLGLVAVLILGWFSYQRERAARAAADSSRRAETSQRRRAEMEALQARQFQYASDMNLAHQAVDDGNLFRALQLLDRHRPSGRVASVESRGASNETDSLPASHSSTLNSRLSSDLRGWEWRYLWKQCEGEELAILGVHSNGVTAVGFLPDGKTAFSAGNDHAVRLWDLETKKQIALLLHATKVAGVACSPDGRWLATSPPENNDPLLVWDLATRQATPVSLTNVWLRPNSLASSPDSKLLAFASYDSGVRVWSLADRRVIAQLPAYHHWLGSLGLAFSPGGQTLAYTENEAGDIVLWNLSNQSVTRRLKGHTWYVTALAFTPDGQLLVSGSADRTIKLWDVAAGVERSTFTNYTVGLGTWEAASLRLSRDGKMLATAAIGGGQRISIQEVPSGREIVRLRGHQHLVTDGAFSADGRTFLSGSLDGTVRLWDLTAAEKETDHRQFPSDCDEFSGGSSPAYSLSPDGLHLLTIFTNRTFSVWELPALTESPRLPLPVSRAVCAALATGGRLAAFVATNGDVVFWRGGTGETNWFARPTTNQMSRAAFSPDGTRFALGGTRDVRVCEVSSEKTLFTFPLVKAGEYDLAFSLAFSPDGQKLAAGLGSGLVKAWDFTPSAKEVTLRGRDLQVNCVAFSPDGQTLVSTARDIRLWDLKLCHRASGAPSAARCVPLRGHFIRRATPGGGSDRWTHHHLGSGFPTGSGDAGRTHAIPPCPLLFARRQYPGVRWVGPGTHLARGHVAGGGCGQRLTLSPKRIEHPTLFRSARNHGGRRGGTAAPAAPADQQLPGRFGVASPDPPGATKFRADKPKGADSFSCTMKSKTPLVFPSEVPIWVDPERVSGAPCFKGTRVPVESLFTNLESGLSLEQYLDCFPDVTRERAVAVLEYAHKLTLQPEA